jgi:hypothetical protein
VLTNKVGQDDLLGHMIVQHEGFAAAADGGPFPASMAIGFHLVDYVVHTWDVAVSMELDVTFEDDLVAAALQIAEQGAAFKPVLPIPAGSSELERLLLILGRNPSWAPH